MAMTLDHQQSSEYAAGAPIIFASITLTATEIEAANKVNIRPPAKRGDLDGLSGGTVVAIVDGELSEEALPVDEICRALHRGVKISGAASVGALRAHETRNEGMKGTGWVYNAYCAGRITGPNEIAVLYDPVSYSPHTIPLVNVRFCLERLSGEHAITDREAACAMTALKDMEIRERRWQPIVRRLSSVFGRVRAKELLRRTAAAESDIKKKDARDLLCRLGI
jgi:hypothetical protein